MKLFIKRKLLHFILILTVFFGFVYMIGGNEKNVKAADAGTLTIGTNTITGTNYSIGGGTVSFTESSTAAKIVLNNVNFNGEMKVAANDPYQYSLFRYDGSLPLEIEVNGNNTFQYTGTLPQYCTRIYAFYTYVYESVTFTGSGSLTVKSPITENESFALKTLGDVYFNGPNCTFTSLGHKTPTGTQQVRSYGILMNFGNKMYINKGKIVANGGTTGGNSSNTSQSCGAFINNSKMYINGGVFEANGGTTTNEYGKSYAMYGFLTIYEGANRVTLTGETGVWDPSTSQTIYNQIKGCGYETKTATTYTSIPVSSNTSASSLNVYKKVEFINEISVTAKGYDGAYDGKSHTINITVSKPTDYTIKYGTTSGTYNLTTAPSYTDGTHTIYYQVTASGCETKTGSVVIKIVKEDPKYTAPTAKTGLTYNGSAQKLVNAGSGGSGASEIQYRIGTSGTYSTNIPTAINPGTYEIYYKVVGDATHNTLEDLGPITVTIAKATIPSANVTVEGTYSYNGFLQSPVLAKATSGLGNQEVVYVYSTSSDGEYSQILPSFVEPGTYTIYYKANANYHNEYSGSFNFMIAKATISDVAVSVNGTYQYNTELQTPSITKSAMAKGNQEVIFTYSKTLNGTYTQELPAFKYGEHTIYYKISANYHNDYNGSFEFVIESIDMPDNVDVTSNAGEFTYNGNTVTWDVTETGELPTNDEIIFIYSISEAGTYEDVLPILTNAGEYTIYWMATADGYNSKSGSFDVVIYKANSSYSEEPSAIPGLLYTRLEQNLITSGNTICGDIVYSLSEDGEYSSVIPTGVDVAEYIIYFKIIGNNNYNDSSIMIVKSNINENDKTELLNSIAEGLELYNTIKDGYTEIAAILKNAIDTAKEFNEDKNVLISEISETTTILDAAILKARDDSRDIIIDAQSGVTIVTGDGSGIPTSINLVVEQRVEIKAEKGTDEYKNIQKSISKGYKLKNVYDVKLIRIVDGVETEIQPSDVKEGMTLVIHITVPNKLKTKGLKILHVSNESEILEIEEYKIENNEIIFEVSQLSEFIILEKNNKLAGWTITLIIISCLFFGLALLYLLLFFVFNKWINKDGKALRVIKIGKKDGKIRIMYKSFKIDYKDEVEIFKTKAEALK